MPCLDENQVVGFVEGGLGDLERSGVESHLAGCAECAAVVALAAGADIGPASPAADEADSPASGLSRGATVGRYVILDLVGRGGMGAVYAAYDPQLDRKVALKLLNEHTRKATGRERLLREAKAIARLSHPNVVVVHDAGAVDDSHGQHVFLAMEFIEGETLAAWLASPRSWHQIRDVFAAAGEGLAAAHDAGLVHRDFKPQNVMVTADGSVRVMDFGLASDGGDLGATGATGPGTIDTDIIGVGPLSPHTVALTRTGMLLGTPLYMAPEQFLARRTDARTDQFSYCVALYEALYGQRPFPSESWSVLVDAVVAGRVREPPQKVRVPGFLRRLTLRGLATSPDARFPSMPVLLEALRYDPARRRRRLAVAVGAAVLAVTIAGGTQRWATSGKRLCQAAAGKLAGVWDSGELGTRRGDVHRAFIATGRSFAEETWNRVSSLLDDYARTWTRMYTDACEATHVRGDQSADVLDLRMSCLEGNRGALRAVTEVLSRGDAAVLVQAVNAVQGLPSVDRCADLPLLRSPVPLPTDPRTRAKLEELRARVAELKALTDTGQWPAADAKAGPLVEAVRATRYKPLLAEALAARAWLEGTWGQIERAERTEEEALRTALAARRDDIALESAAQLVALAGYNLGRYDEAARWAGLGEALLERLGPGHDRAASWLANNRANVEAGRGEYDKALVHAQAALTLKLKVLPPDHTDVAITLTVIANAQTGLGRYDAALEAAEKIVEVFRRAYGPQNPIMWRALSLRGEALSLLGRRREAEADLRAAIRLSTAWMGAEHHWNAYPMTALGKTLTAAGRPAAAIPLLWTALRIREQSDPHADLVAETRFALASALWAAGGERDAARAMAAAARDAYRSQPSGAKPAAEIDAWLASHAGD